MENEKKVRQHKIVDSNPYLGGILHMLAMYAVMGVIQIIAGIILAVLHVKSEEVNTVVNIISAIPLYFISLWWFKPDLKNVIRKADTGLFIRFIIAFVIFWIVSVVVDILALNGGLGIPSFAKLLTAIAAGTMEELLFRGFLITPMLKGNVDRKRIITAIIISSVAFGLIHSTNIFMGADVGMTIKQLFTSALLGVCFGSMYIATGSLLPCIIIHTVHDIVAFSSSAGVTDNGIMVSKLTPLDFIVGVGFAAILAFAIVRVALNKDRDEETINLWKETWNNK